MKTTIALACLVLGAAAWHAADAPGPSAFTVLDQQPAPGPRVTAYLQYQLDRAWQQDEAASRPMRPCKAPPISPA